MSQQRIPHKKQTEATTSRKQAKPPKTTKTIKPDQRPRSAMGKEELLKIIRQCARKLGRVPSAKDLRVMAGITPGKTNYTFGSLGRAIKDAGLKTVGNGYAIDTEKMLRDYALVARKVGRLPSAGEYLAQGGYSFTPFHRRYGKWQDVPAGFLREGARYGLDKEFPDVAAMARRPPVRQRMPAKELLLFRNKRATEPVNSTEAVLESPFTEVTWRILPNRPLYGPLWILPVLTHAPTTELEVVHLFGKIGHRLGFVVLRMDGRFPDCEALRRVRGNRWQRVLIEFEIDSWNFSKHRHSAKNCDMIVCWRHNWKQCPDNLEVLELRTAMANLR